MELTDKLIERHVTDELLSLENKQTTIPLLAKNKKQTDLIGSILPTLPTNHKLIIGDARTTTTIKKESVHLIVTSPPYWTLKQYNEHEGQLGSIAAYDEFIRELNKVWRKCYRWLIPGGRLICVVGDVCLSRRRNNGRHTCISLHSTIQESCRKIGYDNLAPIIWHKIGNIQLEASRSSSFLGKPYEPNAIIKNDIEYILMERKHGKYRSPTFLKRVLSVIPQEQHRLWFNQIWSDVTGASTKTHPAPYPDKLVERLIRMYSFVGDVVLDPFLGSGTTSVVAAACGRNSIGIEIDPAYAELAAKRFDDTQPRLFSHATLEIIKAQ